jgi:hypothetical protein
MTGNTSPIGRESMAFKEKMEKYHAEIERMVYAAEILCGHPEMTKQGYPCKEQCKVCIFHNNLGRCSLVYHRGECGNHVKQDDIPEQS